IRSFRYGQTEQALTLLSRQGRIQDEPNAQVRYQLIAEAYAASPQGTLVVSPDNESRMQLNTTIRNELRKQGILGKEAYKLPILVSRDLTTADARRAGAYQFGDVIQYRKGNKESGMKVREYATVIDRDTDRNRITVQSRDGR